MEGKLPSRQRAIRQARRTHVREWPERASQNSPKISNVKILSFLFFLMFEISIILLFLEKSSSPFVLWKHLKKKQLSRDLLFISYKLLRRLRGDPLGIQGNLLTWRLDDTNLLLQKAFPVPRPGCSQTRFWVLTPGAVRAVNGRWWGSQATALQSRECCPEDKQDPRVSPSLKAKAKSSHLRTTCQFVIELVFPPCLTSGWQVPGRALCLR